MKGKLWVALALLQTEGKPLDWFRDPAWQFVGVVLAVAALLASFIFSRKQTVRKKIAAELRYQYPLVSRSKDIQGKLQIIYNEKEVRDIRLVVIAVRNSGNTPIASSDYEKPICINYGKDAEILNANITQMVPEDIGASIDVYSNSITVSPILLNAEDTMEVGALISGFDGEVQVNGRIIGIKSIDRPDIVRAKDDDIGELFTWLQYPLVTLFAFFLTAARYISTRDTSYLLLSIFSITASVWMIYNARHRIKAAYDRVRGKR